MATELCKSMEIQEISIYVILSPMSGKVLIKDSHVKWYKNSQ